MSRIFSSRRTLTGLLFITAIVVAGLLAPSLRPAGAQSAVGAPVPLPGDPGPVPAAGTQERPQLSRGADTYLAVWTDSRTALAGTLFTFGTGLGSLQDIYAARVGADGQIIDTTPIIVSQAPDEQRGPRVGWNGQNWLVTWLTKRPRDQYSHTYDLVAARVSPAGALLDQTPIVIRADVSLDAGGSAVIEDGAGNWVVLFEHFLPQEGTSIPRGAHIARVANDGTVLDPGGRLVYNHHSQFMSDSDIARAGDRYLLTFVNSGPPYRVMGVTLDSNFNQLRNGPEQLYGDGTKPRVASNGETWFVAFGTGFSTGWGGLRATRVSREGDPLDPSGINLRELSGSAPAEPAVAWDGQSWFVAYSSSHNPATNTYSNGDDVYVVRVSPAGAALDPAGRLVKQADGHQGNVTIAPGLAGGAQVGWENIAKFDVETAPVSRDGAVGTDRAASQGAPRQSRVRMATNGAGFLAVFRSEISNAARIMGQHLNADGTPADQEPFVISNNPTANNPSVGWDGTTYLAVWDQSGTNGVETHGAAVPAAGTVAGAPFFIVNGSQPDAAGLNGTFLVANILQETRQIRTTQGILVSGAGAPAGAPFKIDRRFNFWPRVAAFGGRWLVVWQAHNNHDDSPGTIRGSFVEPTGTPGAPFVAGDLGNDLTPHLAVADSNRALVVWTVGDVGAGRGDIYARRLDADGSSPDPAAGMPISTAPALQAIPAVAWDGDEFVVTWTDQRNELFPAQPRGDVYAARVSRAGVPFEEIALASSPLPEDHPFVASANGQTVFAYSKFYPESPYAAMRVTLRLARFGAPNVGTPPAAPSNLTVQQANEGLGGAALNWSDNSDNETGFKLEISSDGVTWNRSHLLPANTTSVAGVTTGTTNTTYFRVRAYNAADDSANSNVASTPVSRLTAPLVGQTYRAPATIIITADASDPDGVAKVEFLARRDGETTDQLIGTDTTAPYGFDWQNVAAGSWHLRAKVTDARGDWTVSQSVGIGVFARPTAQMTAPLDNAVYVQPATITLTATAQTNNNRSDEYVERLDFYSGTRWIGRGQAAVWGGPWSFNWADAPAGNHSITAHATSTFGLTGVSAPINVTVQPTDPPAPNIKPAISLTSPADGATFPAGAAVNVTANASDADGLVNRVEFRAGGRTVATDTTAPYSASLGLTGGRHRLTAVAFDNAGAWTESAAANVTIGRTVGSTQLSAATWDGQSQVGPSVLTQQGAPADSEVADDFDVIGDIDRVVAGGTRGFNVAEYPTIRGTYVRFYAWENGAPGALQDEQFVASSDPGLIYDARTAATFDITLPHAFRATGKHFVSVQLLVEGYSGNWYLQTARSGRPANSPARLRDSYAGGAWASAGNADVAISLYGSLNSAASITSVTPAAAERSGWIVVRGTNLGAEQGASRLVVDGQNAIVAKWTTDQIVGYVPEGSKLGSVSVEVANAAGTSNPIPLNVTARQAQGRLRWRAKVLGDFFYSRAAVAPAGSPDAGSVYAAIGNLTYAWSAGGALKWIARDTVSGPVSVGPDGTVYVGGSAPAPNGGTGNRIAIVALNGADGTRKWRVVDSTALAIRVGPTVGPDGKVYAVFNPGQYNTAAFNPDGTLAWSRDDNLNPSNVSTGTELFFDKTLPRLYFTSVPAGTATSTIYVYDFNGNRVTTYPTGCCGQAVVAPDGNFRVANRAVSAADGSILYNFAANSPSAADAGPDNTHYVAQYSARLFAINPNGTEKWHYDDQFNGSPGILKSPAVSPANNLVFMGGRLGFGQSGFFVGVSPATGQQLWKMVLPDETAFAPYGQLEPFNKATFSADGSTAYVGADVLGDGSSGTYAFFYAVDTTAGDVHVNQPPRTTVTNPLPNSNVPKGSQINFTARVEDDGQVNRVEFFYNHNGTQALIGTDTTPDANGLYSVILSLPEPGVYGLFAAAYDAEGLRGDSQLIAVSASNQAPTSSWVSPANNASYATPPASITLTAKASDSDGTVTGVHFGSDQTGPIGEDATPDAAGNYSVVWSNPPQGAHTLRARATDDSGYSTTAVISVTVGQVATPTPTPTPTPTATPTPTPGPVGQPPTVSITSPADRASFAPGTSVTFAADASDPDGTIARVEFWRDGVLSPLATDLNAPYSAQITSGQPDTWRVYAVAVDNAGNKVRTAAIDLYFEDPSATLKITGRITHQQSTPSNPIYLANALVKLGLGNYPYRTTRTNADGYYTFSGLSYGGRYQITAAEPGYTFYPPSVFIEGLVQDSNWDFTAEGPLPPGPTPTPTPGASALAWERFHKTPYGGGDLDPHLTVDAQGNTYVAGTTAVGAGGDSDISLVKYAPDGTQEWARNYAGPGGYKDWAEAARTDSEGNVYVTGTSWGGSAYEYDIVTVKYDSAGAEQWARRYNGPIGRWDSASAIEIDGAGNAVVAGYSQSSRPDGSLFDEFVVVKYNPAGGVVWERRHSVEQKGDRLVGLAVDAERNVYVTGDAWVGSGAAAAGNDIVTVKYGPDGTRLWVSRFNRAASTEPLPTQASGDPYAVTRAGGVQVDPSTGDVYVFGNSQFGPTGSDYLLLKYSSVTGQLRWNRNWAGPFNDTARALALDSAGNAYLTGESYDGDFETATSIKSADVATVKFTADGALAWERFYRGFPGKTDAGRAVVVDPAGNAYVAFSSEGFVNVDTGVVKYAAGGAEQWVFGYDNPSHTSDTVAEIARDASGHLHVAGHGSVAPPAGGPEAVSLVTFKLTPDAATLNAPPDVQVDSMGATIAGRFGATIAGRPATLMATATDVDGTVSKVDFYDGTKFIGSDAAAPFQVEWTPAVEGAHAITATATDNDGAVKTAKTQLVNVTAQQPTYAISGRLTANGSPVAGALVTLGGSRSAKAKTGADGRYSFGSLAAGGSYTVSPAVPSQVFSPSARSFASLGADQTADFDGSPAALTRTNVALFANGGRVAASSSASSWGGLSGLGAAAVVNGDRLGRPSAGSPLWCDATPDSFPDWIEVAFNGPKTIDEIDLFTAQDDYQNPSEPSEAQTFAQYGVRDFLVQYWTGAAWAALPGAPVTGNDRVWRRLTFAAVTTTKIRIVIKDAAGGQSRIAEIEAYGKAATTAAPVKTNPWQRPTGKSLPGVTTRGK